MTEEKKITKIDIGKHYAATATIYIAALFFMVLCPPYAQNITNDNIDYSILLGFFVCGYILFAPIFYFLFKPVSILESRSLTILGYIKRQFTRGLPLNAYLNNIAPTEKEKQSIVILFMQIFFATLTAHMLCENYIPNLSYNLDFISVMFDQARSLATANGIADGLGQFIIDTSDIWLKLIFTITTVVYFISYISDCSLFRNKIKSVDTTPLGIISCICCYYPITILTYTFLKVTNESLLPVNNTNLLVALNLIVIFANLGSLIAILRLGTKAGNLTNRGIVTGFPYNIVRHPDYAMQIIYILATTIPLFLTADFSPFEKVMMTLTTLAWIYIYYLRAITEERHLLQDEKYQEYCKKVKHRFIPKVF
jgi:protein-S-isoprenylcysteine O-methyltransferase Ste14